jgi:hypothetical protein
MDSQKVFLTYAGKFGYPLLLLQNLFMICKKIDFTILPQNFQCVRSNSSWLYDRFRILTLGVWQAEPKTEIKNTFL